MEGIENMNLPEPLTCRCDLGISHPELEPCKDPEISPVGHEQAICLNCGHDAGCHAEKAGDK